jgi:hypothetical protein
MVPAERRRSWHIRKPTSRWSVSAAARTIPRWCLKGRLPVPALLRASLAGCMPLCTAWQGRRVQPSRLRSHANDNSLVTPTLIQLRPQLRSTKDKVDWSRKDQAEASKGRYDTLPQILYSGAVGSGGSASALRRDMPQADAGQHGGNASNATCHVHTVQDDAQKSVYQSDRTQKLQRTTSNISSIGCHYSAHPSPGSVSYRSSRRSNVPAIDTAQRASCATRPKAHTSQDRKRAVIH